MCMCWDATEDDGFDTDIAAAAMASANAAALALAAETNENAPRAAREPPPIGATEESHQRSYARYSRTVQRIATHHGRDAVTLAAYFDDVDIMSLFLRDASVPRALFEDALKLAVVQGNLRVAELLLASGAARGAHDDVRRYRGPLRLAALKGNREMFALLVAHTRLRAGENLQRVVQDLLMDGAGRNTQAMLLCLAGMPGGRDPAHWKDALVAAASHMHYRPAAVRICLAFDRGATAVHEAVDVAYFMGNTAALRVLSVVPLVRAPREHIRPVRTSRPLERTASLMRARVMLARRNGLRRATTAARCFLDRYYEPPTGKGYLRASGRFAAVTGGLSEASSRPTPGQRFFSPPCMDARGNDDDGKACQSEQAEGSSKTVAREIKEQLQ